MISSVLKHTTDVQWVDRGWYLVTEFEKTPSINFRRAVKLAKMHPGFIQLMDERNVLIYRNIYRENDLLQFQELYKLIKSWKGSKLYFKGDEVDYDVIESGIRCYIRTQSTDSHITPTGSYKSCRSFDKSTLTMSSQAGYIGCRRSCISIEWKISQKAEVPVWFFFGTLDQHNVYNIDKEEIERAVIGHLIEYSSCPLLDLDKITECVWRFPDRIDPRKDKEWKYNRQQRGYPYSGYHKAPAVLPIDEEAYCEYLKRKF